MIALDGITESAATEGVAHVWLPLGSVGRILDALKGSGTSEVVLAGAVRRPSLASLGLDRRGLAMAASVAVRGGGDDGILRRIVAELEGEGFRVVGVGDVLTDLAAPLGPLGRIGCDAEAEADIRRGRAVAAALGDLDVGHGVVVQQGRVLGVEAAEGTDALLARCKGLRLEGRGGVLVKLVKRGQDRRVDLPAIGPRTVRGAIEAGLGGIAVSAGATLVIDREAVARDADAAGLFVVGIADEPG